MQLVLEFGDNAEVTATAADSPEQISILFAAHATYLAIGGYYFGGPDVVERQAVFAVQTTEAAAEREATNAGVRNNSSRGHETVFQGGRVQGDQQRTTLGVSALCLGIDGNGVHLREVNHQAVIADGFARPAMTAATNGNEQLSFTRESYCLTDIGGVQASGNQCRSFVVHAIPDRASSVIQVMTR